ncbi:MAG: hypothetical protein RI949_168 [Pseudomonadota bacterium]|jgi:amidase
MSLHFESASQLLRRLQNKEVSALELVDMAIQRMERLDGVINAVVVRDFDRAREQARASDAWRAAGKPCGVLHGLPMTVKESFQVAGLPTTFGHPSMRHHVAKEDAVAVCRLKSAGAIVMGKTNVPVSLADWQTFNPVYGTTHNPWDTSRTPGGSSGGSAAALAAGFTPLELGSDIGASIRNPAHYCGVWGHKPTWGTVTLEGHTLVPRALAETDISAAGPMARSAHDLALAMEVLSTPLTAWSPLGRVPVSWNDSGRAPRSCRVGVIWDDAEAEVDDAVAKPLQSLVEWLRRQGVPVVDLTHPKPGEPQRPVDSAEAHDVYIHMLRAITGARYDQATYEHARSQAATIVPGDTSYRARLYRGNTLSYRDFMQYEERRERLRLRWHAFFEDFDLLICPVATTPAFPLQPTGERWERMVSVNGQPQPSTTALFWAGYPALVGLPATAIPVGQSPQGLPVGAQIVTKPYADPLALRFAAWLESEWRAFKAPPLD